MKEKYINQVKANIRLEARKRNKSIGMICAELKVNRNYINQLKEGTGINKIIRIAEIISCPPSDLLRNIK